MTRLGHWAVEIDQLAPELSGRAHEFACHYSPEGAEIAAVFLAALGDALAIELPRLAPDRLGAFFALIESLMNHDEADVRDHTATGFVERVASLVDEGAIDIRHLLPHLGQATRAYWIAWDQHCGVTTPGLKG